MKLIKLNKIIFSILVIIILILIIGFSLLNKPKEAFTSKDNSKSKSKSKSKNKLVDYTNADPNIKSTPPQDYCLGDLKNLNNNKPMGYFISNPKANYLVKPLKSKVAATSIEDCEAKCNFDDGCIGMEFDMDTFDRDIREGGYEDGVQGGGSEGSYGNLSPNCTKYQMAMAGDVNTISATSICSHKPGGGIITSGKLSKNSCIDDFKVYPNDNTRLEEYGTFSHSTEGACAYECTMRLDNDPPCEAYYYSENNKGGQNCKIFKSQLLSSSDKSFGFPKSMFCSFSKTYLDRLVNKDVYLFNVKYDKPLGAVYYWLEDGNKGRLVLWGNADEVTWKLTKSGNDYMLSCRRYNRYLGSIYCWKTKDENYFKNCRPVLCDQSKGLCNDSEIKWKITSVNNSSNIFNLREITGNNKLIVSGGDKTNCKGGKEDMGGCQIVLTDDDKNTTESQWRISENEGQGKNFEPQDHSPPQPNPPSQQPETFNSAEGKWNTGKYGIATWNNDNTIDWPGAGPEITKGVATMVMGTWLNGKKVANYKIKWSNGSTSTADLFSKVNFNIFNDVINAADPKNKKAALITFGTKHGHYSGDSLKFTGGQWTRASPPSPSAPPSSKSCEDNPKGWDGKPCSKLKPFCRPDHPFWYEGLPQLCPKTCNQC
tara:strand:- start:1197 stop:3155 length:1959 start_codon:yes stop_codon:yes gene_type:complete